jgi:hypothetical protein
MLTKSLEDMDICFNLDGWGPVSGERSIVFHGVPYSSFDKKEKCSKAADFTVQQQQAQQQQRIYRNRREDAIGNTEFAYKHDAAEDSTFQLVDSTKTTTKRFSGGYSLYILHIRFVFNILISILICS